MSGGADASRRTKLVVSFAIIYLIWGSSYLMTKIGVSQLPPFAFGAVRFMTGGLLLFSVARVLARGQGQSLLPKMSADDWRAIGIVGCCAVFLSNGAALWGLQYLPSNVAALLNVSSSFWIPVLGMFGARGQPISSRMALGLVAGFAGTSFIVWPGSEAAAAVTIWPSLALLFGCFCWSAGTIHIRNTNPTLDLMTFTALQMFCGGLMLLVPALLGGDFSRWSWQGEGLLALAYMTIASSCIAYTAFAWLSVNVTPAQLATYGFVNPAVALLLGWWVLDERLGNLQLLGTAVILAGTVLVNWPRRTVGVDPARSTDEAKKISSVERGVPPAT